MEEDSGLRSDAKGAILNDVGIGALITLDSTEEIVELCLGGGAGFGKPERRDKTMLDEDIADGYITQSQVAWDYKSDRITGS